MKKMIMLATLMVAALSASAQFQPGTFSIQPKIGFGVSTISNAEDIDVDLGNHTYGIEKVPNVGIHVGVEFEYQAKKWLGIAAGLNYTRQGSAWENYKVKLDGVKLQSFNNNLDLGYINLPIVANFYVVKGLALKTGVQFGFLTDAHIRNSVRAEMKDGDTKVVNLTEHSTSIHKDCEKFDLAIPVGISYEFKHHFVIDARYYFGLLKVNKLEEIGEDNSFNRSFQLSFGYKYGLGKNAK